MQKANAVSAITSAKFGLPRLSLPKELETGEKCGVRFAIDTPSGRISVTGWGNWRCRGNGNALIAQGIVRPEWLPGVGENNRVQQRVLFTESGPILLRDKLQSARAPRKERITILRMSKQVYEVELPMTRDQDEAVAQHIARLEQAQEAAREEAARQRARAVQFSQPANAVQAKAKNYAEMAEVLLFESIEHSAYRFDPATERQLGEHFRQISSLIDRARMIPAQAPPHGDNVVHLRK